MSEQDLQEIELNIEQAKGLVATSKAVERLYANPDFQKVFLEGYLKDEAVRLVHLKGDPNMQDPDSQKSILSMIDGISCLTSYIQNVHHQGMLAEKAIESNEESREEILAEEAE